MRIFRSNPSVSWPRRLNAIFKTLLAGICGRACDRYGRAVTFHRLCSSRTEFAGLHGQAYKIKIAAPPEKGKANKMMIAFLAEALNIKKNAVRIRSGQTSNINGQHRRIRPPGQSGQAGLEDSFDRRCLSSSR
ncbi:MAG: DUF167 domain-containing protein [Planctomycetota bacterium]